jgi:NAD(P)-dependent dehydrogenase (short-subunit alcohol dehydrogenase family)
VIWSKSRLPSAPIGRPRSVVVTGASSGIGHASALMLARSGFRDFAGVRKEEDAGALEVTPTAGRLSPLFIDVTDENIVAAAASTVEEAVGSEGIAGVVNNAGIGEAWPLEYVPLAEFFRSPRIVGRPPPARSGSVTGGRGRRLGTFP